MGANTFNVTYPGGNTVTLTAIGGTTHFVISTTASTVAGSSFSITVQAEDSANDVTTSFSNITSLTSTDPQANFGALSFVQGVATTTGVLKTAGTQTITATSGSLTGTSAPITVSAASATQMIVSAPSTLTAGNAGTLNITAEDQYNNIATSYNNIVNFTSSDGTATLPSDASFSNGMASVSVTLHTAGSQTVTTISGMLPDAMSTITVSAATATQLIVSSGTNSVVAGNMLSVTVTAEDQFGNVASTDNNAVTFTSSDATATLPSGTTLSGGTASVSVTLHTAGADRRRHQR